MKIFLIGFMGSGKSTLGRLLAEGLGFPFSDLDTMIVEGEGQSIPEIFAEHGEAAFRQMERRYLEKTAPLTDAVIATGGGAPCFLGNMEWMDKNGLTLYLDAAEEVLFQRLWGERSGRPLLNGKSGKELQNFIHDLLAKRKAFYEAAHFSCRADLPISDLLPALLQYFARFSH